jgi:polynucleotide 5'-kinase involved in rRNA processing
MKSVARYSFVEQVLAWFMNPLQVSLLFESRSGAHPRTTLLLRLPPPNVSLTPEVRCAVVGNVDSGKSTTLGVLTRGLFFLELIPLHFLKPDRISRRW